MKQLRVVLCAVFFMATARAAAQDVPLPDSVVRAYSDYETALASEDFAAASQAAEWAFSAARAAGLADDLQLTLGLNALAMAPSRGTGSGLVALTRATAQLAGTAGSPDTVFDAWMRGMMAAYGSGDRVALETLRTDLLAWLVAAEYSDLSRLNEFPLTPPQEAMSETWLARSRAILAEAEAGGDPVAIANAVMDLRDDAVARQDWDEALALLERGLRAASGPSDEDGYARAALMPRFADLLRDGYSDPSSGEARLSPDTAGLWCAYLARHPIPVDFRIETRVPMIAISRGQTTIVMTPFTVPAVGGAPQLGETQVSTWRSDSLREASREHLEQTRFRPACAGTTGRIAGVEYEGFHQVPTRHARGGGAIVGYRTLIGFTAAD
tara:strand:- start:8918 stop:10066 length:1149 start_codon:yes stop_codon:yes gene_type:complete